MIIPSMDWSFSNASQVSVSFFQSGKDMFSDHFVKGISIFVMFAICFISGAMFKISSWSVEITPPVFGSSLEEIVPPVMTIATFGNCGLLVPFVGGWWRVVDFSIIFASRISFSRIPMLYPLDSFKRIISGSCDCKTLPCQVFVFVWRVILSPGWNVFVFMIG